MRESVASGSRVWSAIATPIWPKPRRAASIVWLTSAKHPSSLPPSPSAGSAQTYGTLIWVHPSRGGAWLRPAYTHTGVAHCPRLKHAPGLGCCSRSRGLCSAPAGTGRSRRRRLRPPTTASPPAGRGAHGNATAARRRRPGRDDCTRGAACSPRGGGADVLGRDESADLAPGMAADIVAYRANFARSGPEARYTIRWPRWCFAGRLQRRLKHHQRPRPHPRRRIRRPRRAGAGGNPQSACAGVGAGRINDPSHGHE